MTGNWPEATETNTAEGNRGDRVRRGQRRAGDVGGQVRDHGVAGDGRPGCHSGLVTAATKAAVRWPNCPASTARAACRPSGAMSAAWSSTASCSSAAHATSGSATSIRIVDKP